jgi:hypothetical protein
LTPTDLLFLGGIELLSGQLFTSGLVRDHTFLDLLGCATQA